MLQHQQTSREATESEMFRLLVENVKDYAIFVMDTEGRVRSWNPGAERLLGYSEDEIIGQSTALFSTPENVQDGVVQREMSKAVETGRGEDERWHIRKDGSRFWSGGTITPLWDEERNLRGFAKILRDRTSQKQSADALKDALAYTHGVVDTVREPLLVLGSDLRVKTANRSFYQTFRVSVQETENRLIYNLGDGQWNIPRLRTLLEEILPRDTSFDGFEVEHDFGAVGRRIMLLNARRFYREGNHTELILLAIEDVTERKQVEKEKALRESEARFLELTAHLHQVLWIMDAQESKMLYVSPGYEKMWGRSCQSLIGNRRSFMEGVHPLDHEMMVRENAAMFQTGYIDAEFRILRPNESVRWVWIRGYPVPEQGRIVRLVGVIEDITEKRLMTEQRDALLARLQLHIERMPLAYVLFDAEFRVIDWNPTAGLPHGW